jgi:ABC-type transporter Mla MlaB component
VPKSTTLTFAIRGPIARADLPGLSERVCNLLEAVDGGGAVALCDVGDVPADAVTVDALARLQLVARRRGYEIRLRRASAPLRALIVFMGLENVIPD